MSSNPFEPFPTMETSRFRLRTLTLEDEVEMHRVSSDPLVAKYLGRAAPTREKIREKIVSVLEAIGAQQSILWALRVGGEPEITQGGEEAGRPERRRARSSGKFSLSLRPLRLLASL